MMHGSSMVRKRAPQHRPRFLCVRSLRRPDRPDSRSYVASWLVQDGSLGPGAPKAGSKAARGEKGLQLFSKGKAKVARSAPRDLGRFKRCARCRWMPRGGFRSLPPAR